MGTKKGSTTGREFFKQGAVAAGGASAVPTSGGCSYGQWVRT